MRKYSVDFWEKLQDILSESDDFDSLFTLASLTALHIPQKDVVFGFLGEFHSEAIVTSKDWARLASLYEEKSYLVLIVCTFWLFFHFCNWFLDVGTTGF